MVGFQDISSEISRLESKISQNKKYTDEMLISSSSNENTLKLLLKGPDQGTLETLRVQIHKLSRNFSDISVKVLNSSVGNVNEGDMRCARHFKAKILAMDVNVPQDFMLSARKEGIFIKQSKLLFEIVEEVKKTLQEFEVKKVEEEKSSGVKGTAEVGNVFEIKVSRNGNSFFYLLL